MVKHLKYCKPRVSKSFAGPDLAAIHRHLCGCFHFSLCLPVCLSLSLSIFLKAKSRDEKMDFLLSIPMRKDQPTTDEIGKRVDTVLVELHTEFGIAARIAISRRMKQPCELSWSRFPAHAYNIIMVWFMAMHRPDFLPSRRVFRISVNSGEGKKYSNWTVFWRILSPRDFGWLSVSIEASGRNRSRWMGLDLGNWSQL